MPDTPKRNWLLTPRGVTWLATAIDAILSAAKLAVGLMFGSQAVVADGMHSASDLVTDLAVLAGVRISGKPADPDHHYGHRRFGTLVAMFVAIALILAAILIAYRAISSLRNEGPKLLPDVPFYLATLAIPIKEVLYRITHYVGRRESDLSLLANAWHHRSDAMSSIAAAAGLAGVMIGGPAWGMLDALAAFMLAAFLLVIAFKILSTSAAELLDHAPGERQLAKIRQVVTGTAGVNSFHAFRARQTGGKIEMDIHIQVNPALTVAEGHTIAARVKHAVMRADHDVVSAIVHVEPVEDIPAKPST